jgi:hypothetical protein
MLTEMCDMFLIMPEVGCPIVAPLKSMVYERGVSVYVKRTGTPGDGSPGELPAWRLWFPVAELAKHVDTLRRFFRLCLLA